MDEPDGPLGWRRTRTLLNRVDEFVAFILRILNHNNEDRVVSTYLPEDGDVFSMATTGGQRVDAKIDVCVDELVGLLCNSFASHSCERMIALCRYVYFSLYITLNWNWNKFSLTTLNILSAGLSITR